MAEQFKIQAIQSNLTRVLRELNKTLQEQEREIERLGKGEIGLLETAQKNHADRIGRLESVSHIHPPNLLDIEQGEPWPKLPADYDLIITNAHEIEDHAVRMLAGLHAASVILMLEEFARWRKLFGIREV